MLNHAIDQAPSIIKKSLFSVWIVHVSFTTLKLTFQLGFGSMRNMLHKRHRSSVVDKTKKGTFCKVLFFPDQKECCPMQLNGQSCSKKSCSYAHNKTSLEDMIQCLCSAKATIDVCVFTITSQTLADVLMKKHKAGIVVKVITDCEKMELNCSQIEQMRASGIQVRHDKTSYFMHHKFAIVDKDILINGSFNWTNQAVTGNQENVILTNHNELVQPFNTQFDKLWNLYKPNV